MEGEIHPLLLNSFDIGSFINNTETLIELYRDYGLFGDEDLRIYARGKSMTKAKDKKNPLGYMWRCRKKNGCKQSESPLKGTFFAKTGLPFSDIMAFIINFVKQEGTRNGMEVIEDWRKRSQEAVKYEQDNIQELYVYLKSYLRKSCCQRFLQ